MPECESCGASIKPGEIDCSFCGHSTRRQVARVSTTEIPNAVYNVDQDSGTVDFGDGIHGARPTSGKDIRIAEYRSGGGKMKTITCSNCGHENERVRMTCEACGADIPRRILDERRF